MAGLIFSNILFTKDLTLSLFELPFLFVLFSFLLFFIRKQDRKIINLLLCTSVILISVSAVYFLIAGFKGSFKQTYTWFDFGREIPVTIGLDGQGSLMLSLVLLITFLVIFYSVSYMNSDKDYGRYFASLLVFAAAMAGIVISFNLLLTFVFWELVGFSSYLLINHWYEKPATSDAARKAFITNRIGDLGFIMGLGLIYAEFGTFEIDQIIKTISVSNLNEPLLFWAGFGFVFGCFGKSAQFPLMVWLPDAMQAPTPVSALLHAATMVAAGVFFLARIFPLLHPDLLTLLAYGGAVTSFIGAFAAATQIDIKKILAYSTISQLGYMMAALGAHSYQASLLHLFTHAIFKACLFLCAGAIIHSMTHLKDYIGSGKQYKDFDPQDIRLMGGLRKRMPFTFLAFALAAMAGAGVPLTSGFLSKDEILGAVTSWSFSQPNPVHIILPLLVFSTSLTTSFYMGRMFFLIFFGGFRLGNLYPELKGLSMHIHEAPVKMLVSFLPLSVLSLFVCFSLNPLDPDKSWILSYLTHPLSVFPKEQLFDIKLNHMQEILHYRIIAVSVVVLSMGFGLSYLLYGFRTKFKMDFLRLHVHLTWLAKLSLNAFYLNKIYRLLLIGPYFRLSEFICVVEQKFINNFVDKTVLISVTFANLIAWFDKVFVDGSLNVFISSVNGISKQMKLIQNGKIQTYLVSGIMALLCAFIWLLM